MDPRQQPPHPQQRTPYISDFVSVPRTRPSSPSSGPESAHSPDKASQNGNAMVPTTGNTTATDDTAQPQAPTTPSLNPSSSSSQLIHAAPLTTIVPRRPGSDIAPVYGAPDSSSDTSPPPSMSASSTPTDTTNQSSTPKHESFALPKMPDIEPREDTAKRHQGLRDLLSIFGVLASALLLAFCLITFVFQSYQVDGPSMQSTLHNSDHLIVWKVPKTIAKMSGNKYIPNRGDVIIFDEPGTVVGGTDKQLVKRVIALPGERITVKDGVTTVYNKDYPNGFNPDRTLPYGKVITDTPGNVDVTVKENQVFAMGDNRGNSLDSRVFGPVSADQIVGKLVLRILPVNSFKVF